MKGQQFGYKEKFDNKRLLAIILVFLIGILPMVVNSNIRFTEAVTVNYLATTGEEAGKFGAWTSPVGGSNVGYFPSYSDKQLTIIEEDTTPDGNEWVRFSIGGEIIGWVNKRGILPNSILTNYKAKVGSDPYNYGVWSNAGGGTKVGGLVNYDEKELTVTKEATVNGEKWVKFSVDGKHVGWSGKAGIEMTRQSSSMRLTGTVNVLEDYIKLDWSSPDKSEPYTYQMYSKKPNSTEFQTISATDLNKKVRVLNIYPTVDTNITYTTTNGVKRTVPASASLERWMETSNADNKQGYGMGLIDVTPVSVGNFNSNPDQYLKDAEGEWLYDVIFLGAWDANNRDNLNATATSSVRDFIEAGRGFLAGHDTIGYLEASSNVNTLTPLLNMEPTGGNHIGDTVVKINRKGLLLEYPWKIGGIGTKLNVPLSHTLSQRAYGDVWMMYSDNTYKTDKTYVEDPTYNFYLTSWNNTAMIQTGHSSGKATPDEQKILANTLFYLAQLTTETSMEDLSAMDVYAPEFNGEEVKISKDSNNVTIDFPDAKDVDSVFEYYVEATGQNTGSKKTSETIQVSNKSGFAGYYIHRDSNPKGATDKVLESTESSITISREKDKVMYLHVNAVDKKGNESETLNIMLDETKPDINITKSTEEWVNTDIKLGIDITDTGSGLNTLTLPDGQDIPYNGEKKVTESYTVTKNGIYKFIATDKEGNKTEHTVTVSKIDKTKPELSIEYTPEGWTDENVTINAKGYDTDSGVQNVRLTTDMNSKNIVSMSDIQSWNGKTFTKEGSSLSITPNEGTSTRYGGFYIPASLIEPDEYYVLSFDMTKLSGDIPIIGGHSTNSMVSKVLIDGEVVENSGVNSYWNSGVEYPNDNEKHHITVYFYTDLYGTTGNKNLYIQPNRSNYFYGYDVLFENIQFEKGEVETPYKPNYKDMVEDSDNLSMTVSENGAYNVTATDNVGNETTEVIEINTIDKVSPTITMSGLPEDYVDSANITVNGEDSVSGVNSITLPDGSVVNGASASYKVTKNGEYTFKITDNVGNTVTKTVTTDKIKIPYTFYLYDSKGNPIEGAGFDLLRNGVKYADTVSDSTGLVDFGTVPADGKYTIKQTKAPEGHVVSPVEKEVEVGDTTEPEEFISYPRGDLLPATGTNSSLRYIITVVVMVATMAVLGVKIRYKRKHQ